MRAATEKIAARIIIYVLQLMLTMNMTMAKDVTLIFDGGMLTGNGMTITGDYTQIIASKVQILDSRLNFRGI